MREVMKCLTLVLAGFLLLPAVVPVAGPDAGMTAWRVMFVAPALADDNGNNGNNDHEGQGSENGGDKVTICHNGNTITISRSGLNGHIPHHPGDYFGECVPGGGTPICVSAASLYPGESGEKGKAEEHSQSNRYAGVTTVPCTTATGEAGVWVDSVSGTPSSGPAIAGPGSFREMHGN